MTDTLIYERYRLVRQIGRGAQGATYLARDEREDEDVALKELDFAGVGSWDTVAVFEREVAVLGGLTHPNIPRILDTFHIEDGDSLRMFLVQEFIEGHDLERRLGHGGELFDERWLREIAEQVLEILAYLHGNSPAVLHRDIKPANLIARPDRSVALVDFGAAQGAQRGEAVIGTTGYMPAEQLMGRAGPASDLFALGATLIHLATRKHPSDLGEGLGLKWREFANLSASFSVWLDRMVAPMPEDRFPTALAAKRALRGPGKRRRRAASSSALAEMKPGKTTQTKGGRYELQRSYGRISVMSGRANVPRGFVRWATALVLVPVAICLFARPLLLVIHPQWLLIPAGLVATLHLFVRTAPLVAQLDGHDRGLDIVWAGEEVVQRVLLDDIAGPDLEKLTGGHALVLWTRDGKKLTLDRQYGSAADARMLRAVLHAWLAQARRRK